MRVELAPSPLSPPPVTSRRHAHGAGASPPQAHPARGPGQPTGPLGRRLAAWLVDLGLILAPTAVVAFTQTQSTPAPAPETAAGVVSWASVTVNGTLHRIPGDGLGLTAVAAGMAALIVLTLIPATVGCSPGLRVAGLRVISANGTRARLHQHLIRTVVGLADLAPFALPGLLGCIVAARSPRRQRLGDRAAGTVVVERRHPERPQDPGPGASTAHRWWQPPTPSTPPGPGAAAEAAIRWAIDEADAGLTPARSGTTPSTVEQPTPDGSSAPDEAGAAPPTWSDEQQAWVVTAPGGGLQFRHDPGTDRWLPVT